MDPVALWDTFMNQVTPEQLAVLGGALVVSLILLLRGGRGDAETEDAEPSSPTSPRKEDLDAPIKRVLVLIAMEAEARPLIDRLKMQKAPPMDPVAPCELFRAEHNGVEIDVVTNGKCGRFGVDNVGTNPAVLAAHIAIQKLKPDLVINAGTAGGFMAKGGSVGDVYVSTCLRHHDRRIPIPGFEAYGRGEHEAIEVDNLVKSLGFKKGVVTTSNSLDHSEIDRTLMQKNDASVKDMEGAAIAWVTELHGVPFFSIKVVTDIVDGSRPTEQEFLENLHRAAQSLERSLPKVLDFISGKSLRHLQYTAAAH